MEGEPNKKSGPDQKRRTLISALLLLPGLRLENIIDNEIEENKKERLKDVLGNIFISSYRDCVLDRVYFQRYFPANEELSNDKDFLNRFVEEILLNITKNINNKISDENLSLLKNMFLFFLNKNKDFLFFLEKKGKDFRFDTFTIDDFKQVFEDFIKGGDFKLRNSFYDETLKTNERKVKTNRFIEKIQVLYRGFFDDSISVRPYISLRMMQDMENVFSVGENYGSEILKSKIRYFKDKGMFNSVEDCKRLVYQSFDDKDGNIDFIINKLFEIPTDSVVLDKDFFNKGVLDDMRNIQKYKSEIDKYFSDSFYKSGVESLQKDSKNEKILEIIKNNFSSYLKNIEDKTEEGVNHQIQAFFLWFHDLKKQLHFKEFNCTTIILFLLNSIFPDKKFNVTDMNSEQIVSYLSKQFSLTDTKNGISHTTRVLNIATKEKVVSFKGESKLENNFMYICGVNSGGHMVTASLNMSDDKINVILNDQHDLDRHLLQFPLNSFSSKESFPVISIKDIAKYYTLTGGK